MKVNMHRASQCFSKAENGAGAIHACMQLSQIRTVALVQKHHFHPSVLSKKETSIIHYPRDKPEHLIAAEVNQYRQSNTNAVYLLIHSYFSYFLSASWTIQACHMHTQQKYRPFPNLQLSADWESLTDPQLVMALRLIIWNFCLTIVIYSCEISQFFS